MKNIKALVILLIVPLILFSGCTGKSAPLEQDVLLIEKEPFRVTSAVETSTVEYIEISGFTINSTTNEPEKIIITATSGSANFWKTLEQKELEQKESIQITVWEDSSIITKTITVKSIHHVIIDGISKVAADVNIKTIQ